METLIYPGSAVKALGEGKVGGYLVRFGDADQPDLAGDWFTKNTYFGSNEGNGADCLFHHAIPIKGLNEYADHLFAPIKAEKRDEGIWAETVLNMADNYERRVYGLVEAGKIGWSSGSAPHMVRRAENKDAGEITRWPIIEGSLTPTPCEPRARAGALKALAISDVPEIKLVFEDQEQAEEAYFAASIREMRAIEMQYIQREFMQAEAQAMLAFLAACRN